MTVFAQSASAASRPHPDEAPRTPVRPSPWRLSSGCLALAAACLLSACVTSETTRTVNDAGRSATQKAPVQETAAEKRSDREEETRRRAQIRLELAAGHYQNGNYPQALDEARTAATIDPNNGATYGMQGIVYMAIGDQANAEAAFRKGLQAEPKDPEINNNFGWYLCQSGRERESIDYFERAASDRLYATPAKPLHNAGICLRRLGDDAGAEGYFQRAFQIDPGNAVAMYNLAELYLKQGRADQARFYSDRLLGRYQPTAESLWLGARVAQATGDRDQYLSLGRQLRNNFPDSPETAQLTRGGTGSGR